MTTKYPEAFIEQALMKVFSRGSKSIKVVADELNVNHHTLKYWMKNKSVTAGASAGAKEKRPQDWTSAERFVALQQTHGLAPEALQAWCREKGIFPHHLTSWQAAFCAPAKDAVAGTAELRLLKHLIASCWPRVSCRESVTGAGTLADTLPERVLQHAPPTQLARLLETLATSQGINLYLRI